MESRYTNFELEDLNKLEYERSALYGELKLAEEEWNINHQFRWKDFSFWKILDFMMEMDEEPKMEDDPKIKSIKRKIGDVSLKIHEIADRAYSREKNRERCLCQTA